MFTTHVTKKLSAYCQGELSRERALRVAEHLLSCARCRREFDEIKLGIRLAHNLGTVSAPESLWADIEAGLDAQQLQTAAEKGRRSGRRGWFTMRWPQAMAAAVLIIASLAAAAVWYVVTQSSRPWRVTIGNGAVLDTGSLRIGELIETSASERAKILVGKIGEVDLEPNTRVRLLEAHALEHRLALDQGRLHAKIWAPPRLFFVNTPSAIAIDLGCAYTLEVNDAGESLLRVTDGRVQLVDNGREATVPAGAVCATRPGSGPGIPYFEDSTPAFREALAMLDSHPPESSSREMALDTVLVEARRRDALSLWHLLWRVGDDERLLIYEVLVELVEPPEGVTREGVMALDRDMLEYWFTDMDGAAW